MKLKKGPLEPSEDASEEENISTFWAEKEAQTFFSNSQISLCRCGQVCSHLAAAGPGRSVQGIGGGRSIDRRQSRRRLFLIQPFWLANPSSLATPCTSSATKINRQRADIRVPEHLRRESRGGGKPISPVVWSTSCGGGRRPAAAADAAQGGPQPSGACSDHRVGDGRGGSRVDVGGNGTRGEELLLGGGGGVQVWGEDCENRGWQLKSVSAEWAVLWLTVLQSGQSFKVATA